MRENLLFKLSFLCLALIIAAGVLAACGETKKNEPSGVTGDYLDAVPGNLDYGGEVINIVHWDNEFVNWELTSDGTSGDIVETAVYKRNLSVEERLNVELNFIKGDIAPEYFMPIVRDEILSGSTDYDIVSGVQCTTGPLTAGGCYLDLADAKYLDLSREYWNADYINQLSIGNNKVYMLGGDITLTTTAWSATMLFDLKLFENVFGNIDDFYQLVYDGDWTLDAFYEYCRGVYQDLNGNGLSDVDDQFGVGILKTGSVIDQFLFSSGVKYSTRDENNVPVLDIANEKSVKFAQEFYEQTTSNPGFWMYDSDYVPDQMNTLFMAANMDVIREKRGDEEDFGVIPYPKLDSNESKYHAWISDNTLVYSVPITMPTDREDMVSAVLEVMAGETRRLCLPAYYEIALQDKYTRDDWSNKMLDIIHDGATSDFVSIYSQSLKDVGGLMRQLIGYDDPDIMSNYAARRPAVEAKFNELLKAYDENTKEGYTPVTLVEDIRATPEPRASSRLTIRYRPTGRCSAPSTAAPAFLSGTT